MSRNLTSELRMSDGKYIALQQCLIPTSPSHEVAESAASTAISAAESKVSAVVAAAA